MNELPCSIAEALLKIEAIKISFKEPFKWTSGIISPIYCDNRKSLSYSEVRTIIKNAYVEAIKKHFPEAQVIAGVASGAVAQGALVADELNLPFVYVRPERKEHGLMKIVEGHIEPGQKTVIIEDLVSTGGSSIKAMNHLRNENAEVLGMIAAFTYEFPEAKKQFEENKCVFYALSTFSKLKDTAVENGYISKEEGVKLIEWHKDPQNFTF